LITSTEQAFKQLREGIANFEALYLGAPKRKDKKNPESRAQRIMQVLDMNPKAGRALLQALPDEVANVLIVPTEDGRIPLPKWFMEMLTVNDERQAAMIFYRETFLAQVRAFDQTFDGRPSGDTLV